MKRDREEGEIETTNIANLLVQLSKINQTTPSPRLFTCKTCDRHFTSFQALGGHRASHKKPKFGRDEEPSSPPTPRGHKCSICGLEFPMGQALGGHMRRHRGSGAVSDRCSMATNTTPLPHMMPVMKRSNSKRVTCCLDLDLNLSLNLTPLESEDSKLQKEAFLYRFI